MFAIRYHYFSSYFTSVSVNWLPHIIRQFSERYQNVRFELLAGDYNEITERIRCGKIDCGFLTTPVADELFQPLYCDQMMAVLPADHPLVSKTGLTFKDIKEEPFIMPMKGSDQDIRSITDKNIKFLTEDRTYISQT